MKFSENDVGHFRSIKSPIGIIFFFYATGDQLLETSVALSEIGHFDDA